MNKTDATSTSDKRCTLIGVFEDRLEAERAVRDLEYAGFGTEDVGYVVRGSDVGAGGMITDETGAKDARGAAAGAITGAAAGGILAAVASLLIPGAGPVLAAGILTTAIGFAGAGAAVGGILGALAGLEVSEDEARYYEKAFNEGKALVAVKAGNRAAEAANILRTHGGYDLQSTGDSPIQTRGVFSEP
jgi:hypothetical protein